MSYGDATSLSSGGVNWRVCADPVGKPFASAGASTRAVVGAPAPEFVGGLCR